MREYPCEGALTACHICRKGSIKHKKEKKEIQPKWDSNPACFAHSSMSFSLHHIAWYFWSFKIEFHSTFFYFRSPKFYFFYFILFDFFFSLVWNKKVQIQNKQNLFVKKNCLFSLFCPAKKTIGKWINTGWFLIYNWNYYS